MQIDDGRTGDPPMNEGRLSHEQLDGDVAVARFEQTVELDASLEAAWTAISDPDGLARWLGATVELDVRPGGRGRIVDDDGTVRDILVTDVRHGEGIAWHWWGGDGDLSSVALRLDERDGHTRLHIVETTLFPSARPDRVPSQLGRCTRRWTAATSRLWRHVGVASFA